MSALPAYGLSQLRAAAAERIALANVAGFQSLAKPAASLFRRSVSERIGHHIPLRFTLQAVVADRARRA